MLTVNIVSIYISGYTLHLEKTLKNDLLYFPQENSLKTENCTVSTFMLETCWFCYHLPLKYYK